MKKSVSYSTCNPMQSSRGAAGDKIVHQAYQNDAILANIATLGENMPTAVIGSSLPCLLAGEES